MSCERYEELLQEHLDRSLGKTETNELMAHLDGCSRCRTDYLLYRRLLATVEEMGDVEAPADLAANVAQAIDKLPVPRRVTFLPELPQVRWGWAAAGIAALVLVGFLALQPVGPGVHDPGFVRVAALPVQSQPVVAAPATMARVVAGEASLEVQRADGSTWSVVAGEARLALGDRVRTGEGGRTILYFEDRGRLTLSPKTELQIIAAGVRVRRGSTWIKIAKRGIGFHAETPNAVASVKGTVFTVAVDDALPPTSRVNVFQGLVEVRPGSLDHPGEGAVLVAADQRVDVTGDLLGESGAIELAAYEQYNMAAPQALIRAAATPLPVEPVDAATTVDATVTGAVDTAVDAPPVRLLDRRPASSGLSSSATPRGGR